MEVKDNSFSINNGFNGFVKSVAIQDDGKIMVGGNSNAYDGDVVNKLTRLESNGVLDSTFEANSVPTQLRSVLKNIILSDGSHIAVGEFYTYNKYSRSRVVKLTPDGQIDFSFNSTAGPFHGLDDSGGQAVGTDVTMIRPAGNGTYFVAGKINEYSDTLVNNVVKINADGSLDNSFETFPTSSFFLSREVTDFVVQSDGKVVMIGEFTNYNGQSTNGIVRLNTDGTVDDTFNIGNRI